MAALASAIFVVMAGVFLVPPAAVAQMYDKDQKLIMPERPTSNYGFLEGCWKTDPFRHAPHKAPGTSTYCFDAAGSGTLVYETAGWTCRLPATARYQGSKLRIVDSDGVCTNNVAWGADHLDCERRADGVAFCSGSAIEPGSRRRDRWTVNLHRQGPPPAAAESVVPPPAAAPTKPKSLESLFERR